MASKWPVHFLLFLLFFGPFSSSSSPADCQFGECTHWKILLVPLLTDKFTQVPLLKAIVRSMLAGCRWYFPDQISIEMFTKNSSFVPIKDPILLPELDRMLDQFKLNGQEREARQGRWRNAMEMAVTRMNGTKTGEEEGSEEAAETSSEEEEEETPEWGRFIFVITDFGQTHDGHGGSEFLAVLDQQLTENGIFFRNVRLQFDGNKQTRIIPGGGHSSFRQDIRNISTNILQLAIVEPGAGFDAFAAIRPCPQLNDEQKIQEYSYVQHFYYQNWFLRNPRGALIGFGLFLCAILCAISAYFFHFWEQTRARRKATRQQQQAAGGGGEKCQQEEGA